MLTSFVLAWCRSCFSFVLFYFAYTWRLWLHDHSTILSYRIIFSPFFSLLFYSYSYSDSYQLLLLFYFLFVSYLTQRLQWPSRRRHIDYKISCLFVYTERTHTISRQFQTKRKKCLLENNKCQMILPWIHFAKDIHLWMSCIAWSISVRIYCLQIICHYFFCFSFLLLSFQWAFFYRADPFWCVLCLIRTCRFVLVGCLCS